MPATIHGTVLRPDLEPVADAHVHIDTVTDLAFLPIEEAEVFATAHEHTDDAGDWTVDVPITAGEANEYSQTGIVYAVTYTYSGTSETFYIDVPIGGPHWVYDLLVETPDDLDPPVSGGAAPTGVAGGDLTGEYPNPSVDVFHAGSSHLQAQQAAEATAAAALAAHETAPTHDASLIAFTPDGSIEATNVQDAIVEVRDEAGGGPGGGAPADATYLVTTADGTLTDEVVVGATPGGELGGTWDAPTVAASHAGSTHAAVQAAAEATAAAALSAHTADTTAVHGIADTSALETTTGAQAKVDSHAADTTTHGTVGDVVGTSDSQILTNKTIAVGSNTVSGTKAQFDTAVSDGNVLWSGDAAAGVLAGTYPSPSFAADMATQAELDAHTGDTSGAHAASAISFTPEGSIAATDVQAAIQEVRDEAAGGGAPSTVDYYVGTASGGLSAEIVIGTTSTDGHVLRRAAGTLGFGAVDLADSDAVTGVLPDANIASTIARDSEVTAAVSAHESDTSSVHGITNGTTTQSVTDTVLNFSLAAFSGAVHKVATFDASTGTANAVTISTFIRDSLLNDPDAATALTTLGISAFVQTILNDADAAAVLTTLGVSSYIQTLLNDSDAATARATLGITVASSAPGSPATNDLWVDTT